MKRRRPVFFLALFALLVSTVAGVLPIGAGIAQTPAPNTAPFTVTLELHDIFFEPNVLKIPANQDVVIRIENVGAALHDFVIPGRQIAVEVLPGESAEVTVNVPLGGYSFICSVPGHKEAGMIGTLLAETSAVMEPAASPSPAAIAEWNLAGLSARDLLPDAQDLDGEWTVADEGERSDAELAEALGEEGEELLLTWGWQANAYRDFARENPAQFTDEATYVSASIHAFADGEGAASAMAVLAQMVADAQDLEEIPVDDLGYTTRVLSGPGDDVNLTVVYVQPGNFLIRVGASSEAGDPTEFAIDVAETILANETPSPGAEAAATVATVEETVPEEGSPTPQASAVATVAPVASPTVALDDLGCEGLSAYSRQVLAIETDTWDRLVAAFDIDADTDLLLLEEEQFADLAVIRDSEAAMLMQLDAPGFAEDWHQSLIASAQFEAAIARLAPQLGSSFAAHVHLWDVSEVLDTQKRQAYLDAVDACPAFATFWNEWSLIDGEDDSPPEAASDYSSCAGLGQYDSDLGRAVMQAMANRPDLAETFFEFADADDEWLSTRSPGELIVLSQLFKEIANELGDVTPPDYALQWHLTRVGLFDLLSAFMLAAAGSGFESAEAEFGMQYGMIGIMEEESIERASEECDIFADFAAS